LPESKVKLKNLVIALQVTILTKYLTKKKSEIFACFVDLRRAFDTVWHEGLLYKLKGNKIGRKLFTVIKDMYSCCQSSVKIDIIILVLLVFTVNCHL
jgi:hypothetical protein